MGSPGSLAFLQMAILAGRCIILFYFQIVLTLLMPGRLIAWAWLAEKGLRHALGPWTERHWLLFSSEPDWGPWKERFYPSVLYPCLTKGPVQWDGLCHQRDSVNSSEPSPSSPPLFSSFLVSLPLLSSPHSKPCLKERDEDIPNGRPDRWHYEFDFLRKGQSFPPLQSLYNNSHKIWLISAEWYVCSLSSFRVSLYSAYVNISPP